MPKYAAKPMEKGTLQKKVSPVTINTAKTAAVNCSLEQNDLEVLRAVTRLCPKADSHAN